MNKEIYWEKALYQTKKAISSNSLFPLKTNDITKDIYSKKDFIIRELDISKFTKNKLYGPQINPFQPWEKLLELGSINDTHHLILNKYPVQIGHILLITKKWMPQDGWLDINDWRALIEVSKDTNGLWFFNSGPIAGASQPHRHLQLLRRNNEEIICPRENWLLNLNKSNPKHSKLQKSICVKRINTFDANTINDNYLNFCEELDLGNPNKNKKPLGYYNLLVTNKWIAIIKRKKDNIQGFSINALGFAGYILVTNYSNINLLKRRGPENLLENFI